MELEDIIEPAKSGRARCKTTGDKIPKGELRFGEAFVNTFSSSGSIGYRWHKLEAAAKRFPKKVKKALEAYEGEVPERETPTTRMLRLGMVASGLRRLGCDFSFTFVGHNTGDAKR